MLRFRKGPEATTNPPNDHYPHLWSPKKLEWSIIVDVLPFKMGDTTYTGTTIVRPLPPK